MRRIRLLFLVLGVLLLLPIGLLVKRALEGVSRERELSHRAIAERVFDEMERELSDLLRAQEERSFAEFRKRGRDAAAGLPADAESAGSDAQEEWVVGTYEVDPAGNIAAPKQLEAEIAEQRASAAPTRAAPRDAFRAIDRRVDRVLADADDAGPPPRAFGGERLQKARVPAATEPAAEGDVLGGAGDAFAPGLAEANAPREAEPERKEVSPYEALQSLNKGALARSDRQVKLEAQSEPPRLESAAEASTELRALGYAAPDAPAEDAGRSGSGAFAEAQPEVEEVEIERAPAPVRSTDAVSDLAGKRANADAERGEEIFARMPSADANVAVYPMSGRLADASRLVLERNVLVDGARYRQGLYIDVPALFRHLDGIVAANRELSPLVERSFYTAAGPPPDRAANDGFAFRHQFAEPFDALGVELELMPLPDEGGSAYLTAIAVLLLVTGVGGLLALYRMVAVTVRFAERRNNFVAAVSHELKTPLTAIRMYAEMLRDGMVGDADKRREYYGTITAESERLTRLINNVLEFSRLEQGTREANLVAGSLGPVVREAATILTPHARELGFRVEVEIEAGLPAVRFERDAVLQVVFNLVDNALKYAHEASDRVVTIRCAREGEGVSISVRDRGPGVPAAHLSKIFEPFYRCEDELTRTAKGTGIGLALVRGLAEAMDAAVTGRNPRDGGFEVSVRFRPVAS